MTIAEPAEFSRPGIPEIASRRVGSCRVCGGSLFEMVAEGFDYELLTCRNVWQFGRCAGCGHIQLDPRPDEAALPVIYPPHYYSYDMQKSVGAFAMWGKRLLDSLKFSYFLKLMGKRPQAYIDIGCGDMKYLDLLHAQGVAADDLYGLELDDRVAELGRSRGYHVYTDRVETAASIPPRHFDLATMFHVIEHVDDPAAVVRKIGSWLKPGGFLVLETPNFESWDARLFRKTYWGGYHFPRHWHIFTPGSLAGLLERNGYEVRATRFQIGHAFWLYSLHHWIRYNRRMPSPTLARLFHPFKNLPLLMLATAFDILRARLGFRTSAVLVVAQLRH